MIMSKKIADVAAGYFRSGYNCAEAVFLAAIESYELDHKPGDVRLATGFGGGLGRGEVCGALCGALLVLGAVLGREKAEQGQDSLKVAREQVISRFEAERGSVQCRELKTEDREDCVPLVRAAAAALAEVLEDR